nr:reverse transcriptase domain-containing protein [Tanacetum cinerariifolium]
MNPATQSKAKSWQIFSADFLNEIPVGSDARDPEQVWCLSAEPEESTLTLCGLTLAVRPSMKHYQQGMIKYLAKANEYIPCFKRSRIKNIPRNQNQKADVLSKLASIAFNHLTKEILVEVTYKPTMLSMKFTWRRVVCTLVQGLWWQKQYYKGISGKRCIATQGKRLGNVIPVKFTLRYQSRQKPSLLQSWPFGRSSSERWMYLARYLKHQGKIIVTNNKTNFVNDPFKSLCEKLNIKQMNTAVAHPQANELVDRANRSLMEGIKTRLGRERAGWVDELRNVLWAHRTSLKTSNGQMPFSLTYGSEAVILVKIGMSIHRTMMIKEGDDNEEEIRLNLDLLQERREAAAVREAKCKAKMEQYYNKRVRHVSIRVGSFVYGKNEAIRVEKC